MKGNKIAIILAIVVATWISVPAVDTLAATTKTTTKTTKKATTVKKTVKAPVLQKRLNVESPVNKKVYTNSSININGWGLDPSGVKVINIYMNGKLHGQATYGLARADVNKAYPGYSGGNNSGFTYNINYAQLKTGAYKFTVEMVGKDGKKTKKDISVTVKKTALPIVTNLEKPAANLKAAGNSVNIAGWALNNSGMKQIKVSLDGVYKGDAVLGLERQDVAKIYPKYSNKANSGFSYDLSTLNMSAGNHKLTLEYIGKDGQIVKTDRNFSYDGLAPRISIESIKDEYVTELLKFNVSGWALNTVGYDSVNVYIDGVLNGQAQINQQRSDVAAMYPGYPQGDNSGFSYDVDTLNLASGTHSIEFEMVASDGAKLREKKTFKLNKPTPMVTIETPAANSNMNTSQINISGWALNVQGVNSIGISVDGNFVGYAQYGISRPDLMGNADRYLEAANSGYQYTLDITALPIGKHNIQVLMMGKDGAIISNDLPFNMSGVVEYVYYDNALDYYVDRQFRLGGNVIFSNNTAPTYEQLKYYMDPNNFISDPTKKYMFLKLTYVDGINVNDLNKVLVGKGVLEGQGQAFLDAGKKYNVNPVYLMSHALWETGNGNSTLSRGILVNTVAGVPVLPMVTYNVYGVGAKDANPNGLGSEYAYKNGWFTVADAVIGGAQFISANYITSPTYKQYSLYKMKWNFDTIWHAYATDINWAAGQTTRIKGVIDQMENPVLIFEVPVFKQ